MQLYLKVTSSLEGGKAYIRAEDSFKLFSTYDILLQLF